MTRTLAARPAAAHPAIAALVLAASLGMSAGARAQSAAPASPAPAAPAPATPAPVAAAPSPAAPAPDKLVVYFDTGSASVKGKELAVLDQASRLYRAGHPIVMILSGTTDATGAPLINLQLSQKRAFAVLQGLVARGIPADRFQLLAKGETDPAVPDPAGAPQAADRRVEISWR